MEYEENKSLKVILQSKDLFSGIQEAKFLEFTEETLKSEQFSLKDTLNFLAS